MDRIQIALEVLESHDMLEEAEHLEIIVAACHCHECVRFKNQPTATDGGKEG